MARRSDCSKVSRDESGLDRGKRRLDLQPDTAVCCVPSRPTRPESGPIPLTGSQARSPGSHDYPPGGEALLRRHPFHLLEAQPLAASNSSCIRMERVARIRASIAAGIYHVSAEEIAHSLVTHLLWRASQP